MHNGPSGSGASCGDSDDCATGDQWREFGTDFGGANNDDTVCFDDNAADERKRAKDDAEAQNGGLDFCDNRVDCECGVADFVLYWRLEYKHDL